MNLYAGVDGGQSSTVVALGDADRELARGVGPPADLVGEPRDSARGVAAVRAALGAALAKAGRDPATRVRSLVAGISGFDRGESRVPDLSALAECATIVHDTEIAHAGALGGDPGIVVIAGTGSVALGNGASGEPFVRAGGWGYFFGDEGGAIWIARTAIRRAMARDDRGAPCGLAAEALAFFGTFTLRSIQHAFAHGDLTRPALAAFAGEVLALALAGDPDARAVRDAACAELADLVATVHARLAPDAGGRRVSHAGGLFANAAFAAGFGAAVRARVPAAVLVDPRRDPAAGALALARRPADAAAPA